MNKNSMINSLRDMLQEAKDEHQHTLLRTTKAPIQDTDIHVAVTKPADQKAAPEEA